MKWRWLVGYLFDTHLRTTKTDPSSQLSEWSRHFKSPLRNDAFESLPEKGLGRGKSFPSGHESLVTRSRRTIKATKALRTFSIMHTKFIADPISTWSSPLPKMKASGTTTWRFTKCDTTPVDVETCERKNNKSFYLLLELFLFCEQKEAFKSFIQTERSFQKLSSNEKSFNSFF